jgi:malonate-semialdehyde dehydrogenase (acetylating)/methylmalonate-semialdehyde dehydrogenase
MQTILPREKIDCHNMINGAWVPGEAGTLGVHSPYNGKPIGEATVPSSAQIDHALKTAAQKQIAWGKAPAKERAQILFKFRNILLREADAIAHLKSSECGKTFAEARAGLMKGVEVLEFATAIHNFDLGGKLEVSRGVTCEYRREPLGVVANITPFNFPAMVPLWTIPIALALGNAYVWNFATDRRCPQRGWRARWHFHGFARRLRNSRCDH